jgi:serine beta-lactamase-like protein LACTB, mitochondrial
VAKNRLAAFLVLIGGAIGLLLTAMLGFEAYTSRTTPILHPDPQQVRSVSSSEPSQKWAGVVQQARQIMRAGLTSQDLPGLSVAVGVGGDIVWAEGFGDADVETHATVTPQTRFRVTDASTALTSVGVGLLLEKNLLDLDEEIQVRVPEYPKKPWPVTLRQLMAQVAGILPEPAGGEEPLSNAPDYDGGPAPRCERTIDGLRLYNLAEQKLVFEPGTKYRPSSLGWVLVSVAVEAAAKTPFFAFMRTHVFEPLGMRDTTAEVATEAMPARAKFYWPSFGILTHARYGPKPVRPGDYFCYAGGAAFLSTPSDLARFGMGINGGKLLQPGTVRELQTPQRLPSGAETGYGLGWDLETLPLAGQPTQMAGHGSRKDFIGGSTSFMTFPERGIVLAVMSNISFADTKSIALNIAQAFAAQKP